MKGVLQLIIGLLLIIAGVWIYLALPWFGRAFVNALYLVVGNIPGIVVLIGLIVLLVGISNLKQ